MKKLYSTIIAVLMVLLFVTTLCAQNNQWVLNLNSNTEFNDIQIGDSYYENGDELLYGKGVIGSIHEGQSVYKYNGTLFADLGQNTKPDRASDIMYMKKQDNYLLSFAIINFTDSYVGDYVLEVKDLATNTIVFQVYFRNFSALSAYISDIYMHNGYMYLMVSSYPTTSGRIEKSWDVPYQSFTDQGSKILKFNLTNENLEDIFVFPDGVVIDSHNMTFLNVGGQDMMYLTGTNVSTNPKNDILNVYKINGDNLDIVKNIQIPLVEMSGVSKVPILVINEDDGTQTLNFYMKKWYRLDADLNDISYDVSYAGEDVQTVIDQSVHKDHHIRALSLAYDENFFYVLHERSTLFIFHRKIIPGHFFMKRELQNIVVIGTSGFINDHFGSFHLNNIISDGNYLRFIGWYREEQETTGVDGIVLPPTSVNSYMHINYVTCSMKKGGNPDAMTPVVTTPDISGTSVTEDIGRFHLNVPVNNVSDIHVDLTKETDATDVYYYHRPKDPWKANFSNGAMHTAITGEHIVGSNRNRNAYDVAYLFSATATGFPDTDGDGVINTSDTCPTEYGYHFLDGCPIEDTAVVVNVRGESCVDENDGRVSFDVNIPVLQVNYTLRNVDTNSSSGTVINANGVTNIIPDLVPGTYELTIYKDDPAGRYESTYRFVVEEAAGLYVVSRAGRSSSSTPTQQELDIQGTAPFTIIHDGVVTVTQNNQVTVNLNEGKNHIEVRSAKPCEGSHTEVVTGRAADFFVANPVSHELIMEIPTGYRNHKIIIYNFNMMQVAQGTLKTIQVSNLQQGMYIIKLIDNTGNRSPITRKIIKN